MSSAAYGRNGERPAAAVPSAAELGIIGSSPGLLAAIERAELVAATDVPVLVVGETGTGKELMARFIHERSGRAGDLVDVDCGALPEQLLESVLFGHRRGAFTGATHDVEGLIPRADRGTLFLDELANLPEAGQIKLLRVLETGEVRRIGDTRSLPVDFRVVTSAQTDLGEQVGSGRFRRDLMQRLAGIVIRLPSLDERVGDVRPLAVNFASVVDVTLQEDAIAVLLSRSWPGNVRELRWAVTRAALFARDGSVDARAVRVALSAGPEALLGGHRPNGAARAEQLRAMCRLHGGDPRRVAEALGIGRSTLYRRLKRAGLELASFRRAHLH